MRVALVTEIPAPFRVPLFNALAERVELRVLFLAEHDPRRPHYRVHTDEIEFEHEFLTRAFELRRGGRWLVVNAGVRRRLRTFAPDVVVAGGWNQPALWSARTLRVPTLVWVESTTRDERPGLRALEAVKRRYVRSAAGVLVPGAASADYVRTLGVAEDRIHVAPNAVDTRLFDVERQPHDTPTFLYVGRLDPEKGVDVLVRAFDGVPGELLVAGAGRERDRLAEHAGENVRFLGELARDELPPVYARADVLVLPSLSEPWGMVLNEAATAGLALVATDAVGAAYDLVEDGANGFRVAAGDERALRDALDRLARDTALRSRFGVRSRELARGFTPGKWAAAVVRASQTASVRSNA